MSILNGTIVQTGQDIEILVDTVRIPELPEAVLPYDTSDKLPLYDNSQDKTVWTTISDFITYLNSGGATPVAPVVYGADLEITIGADEAGGYTVTRLPLAGKMFSLERRGVGFLKTSEYTIMPSGGFQLSNTSDKLQLGEFFVAHVYDYVSTTQNSSSSGLSGIAIISSSTQLDSTHKNKLIHIAGGTNKVVITLPDLTGNENLVIPFETMISNTFQTKIVGKVGQKIYFGNTSQDYVHLGISESISLMAGADGWYVMRASEGILNVGKPSLDYSERLNTLIADGEEYNRADYPRLWDFVSSNPDILVDDTTWLSATSTIGDGEFIETFYKYRSKFSEGDGSTTFRVPDLRDLGFVALYNIGSTDPDRDPNTAGTGQGDMIRSHKHSMTPPSSQTDAGASKIAEGGDIDENSPATIYTDVFGGRKTVGKNVGLIPLIGI